MTQHQENTSILRTASELSQDPGPRPPVGEFLWRATRQVRFPSPITSVRGRYLKDGVNCKRGQTHYYRSYSRPADPKTPRQLDQRSTLRGSQTDWHTLTVEQRDAWSAYGRRYFPENRSSSPGPNMYTKAQSSRLGWGETAMSHVPPVLPPPPAALKLEELAAPAAGQLVFRVEHAHQARAGYRIELRMTPATINGRKPQEPELRRAGETAPASFFPLGESGALYLLDVPRFAVAPGERFGLGVRLLTSEGIPGPELRVDGVRKAPEEVPSGTEDAPVSELQIRHRCTQMNTDEITRTGSEDLDLLFSRRNKNVRSDLCSSAAKKVLINPGKNLLEPRSFSDG